MSKFNVHLFVEVRMKVAGIEADSLQEAVQKATDITDFHALLDQQAKHATADGCVTGEVEWTEGAPLYVVVDPLLANGEVDYEKSVTFAQDGKVINFKVLPDYCNPKHFAKGQPVTTSGFPGTIVRHYSEGMWEVRLASGVVCVSGADIKAQSKGEDHV